MKLMREMQPPTGKVGILTVAETQAQPAALLGAPLETGQQLRREVAAGMIAIPRVVTLGTRETGSEEGALTWGVATGFRMVTEAT